MPDPTRTTYPAQDPLAAAVVTALAFADRQFSEHERDCYHSRQNPDGWTLTQRWLAIANLCYAQWLTVVVNLPSQAR